MEVAVFMTLAHNEMSLPAVWRQGTGDCKETEEFWAVMKLFCILVVAIQLIVFVKTREPYCIKGDYGNCAF